MRTIRRWVIVLVLTPFLCNYAGIASNWLVEWSNNGKFPVAMSSVKERAYKPDADGMIDNTHCVMTSETHLNLLADNFDFGAEGIMSIGDFLIDVLDLKEYFFLTALCLVMFKRTDY